MNEDDLLEMVREKAKAMIRPMGKLSVDYHGICNGEPVFTLSKESQQELMRAIIRRTLAGQSSEDIQAALTAEMEQQLSTGMRRMQRMMDTGSYEDPEEEQT